MVQNSPYQLFRNNSIVVNTDGDNSGHNNTCNKTNNWNDDIIERGCTHLCHGPIILPLLPLFRHLFILNPEYMQYFKDGKVDAELKNAFMNEKISLSSDAKIYELYEKNWMLIDETEYYRIEESKGQLNIYRYDIGVVVGKLSVVGLPSKVTAGKEIVMFIKDEDEDPVDGVEVKVEGQTYKTDVNGKVKVKFDKVGSKVIEISKDGYESKSLTIEVQKEKVVEKDYIWL